MFNAKLEYRSTKIRNKSESPNGRNDGSDRAEVSLISLFREIEFASDFVFRISRLRMGYAVAGEFSYWRL